MKSRLHFIIAAIAVFVFIAVVSVSLVVYKGVDPQRRLRDVKFALKSEKPWKTAGNIIRCGDLFYLIEKDDLDGVKEYLKKKPGCINARYFHNESPLHFALRWERKEIAAHLMSLSPDLNAVGPNGLTPLHYLAENCRDEKMLERVMKRSPDVNARGYMGRTPLFAAVLKNNTPAVKILIKHGADLKATASTTDVNDVNVLYYAVIYDRGEMIKYLAENGADVNHPDQVGQTPLHFAVMYEKNRALKTLLKKGADVNRADKSGITALHLALESHSKERKKMILALISYGADPLKKNNRGLTAMEILKSNNEAKMIKNINKAREKFLEKSSP